MKKIRKYPREFSKKFENVLTGYSESREKLIHEKNLKPKISCQTPFKPRNKIGSGVINVLAVP
jgi:hypothetical protein